MRYKVSVSTQPSTTLPNNLDGWLEHLERLHPTTIELGLDRIRQVASRLDLDFSDKQVVTVAGTNGKGSTVSLLRSILNSAGYRVGTYTSPHIHVYNERVCVDGLPVSDEVLCESFAAVEAAREGVSLSYFEFGTLCALHYFATAAIDYLILEVGLGGRLDAVNIVDADLMILTNVALDHMDWLGDSRERIGYEKAGIFRAGKAALYGERDMPLSVRDEAQRLAATLYQQGEDFSYSVTAEGMDWRGGVLDDVGDVKGAQHYTGLPETLFNADTVSTVIQAISLLLPGLSPQVLAKGLRSAQIPGRLQWINRGPQAAQPDTVLDVAHNPHAIGNLLNNLTRHFSGRPLSIVMAMLSDKDIAAVTALMATLEARWYVAQVKDVRRAEASVLHDYLRGHGVSDITCFDTVGAAYDAACHEAEDDTLVLVTGSFFTVADVLAQLAAQGRS